MSCAPVGALRTAPPTTASALAGTRKMARRRCVPERARAYSPWERVSATAATRATAARRVTLGLCV